MSEEWELECLSTLLQKSGIARSLHVLGGKRRKKRASPPTLETALTLTRSPNAANNDCTMHTNNLT